LDFFQPYPGDESIPWSDERRNAVRFRVLRVGSENYAIEDAYCNEVTVLPLEYLRVPQFHLVEWYAGRRAMDLNLDYNQVLPIHHFPIEEILADAIQQYFRDVSHHLPEFRNVEICRVQLEPEFLDNQGPDNF
jgi:hypothetical protein